MRRKYYRATTENVLAYRCRCVECGAEFQAARPEAVYCSCKCKTRAAYWRRKAAALAALPEFKKPSAAVLAKAKKLLAEAEGRKQK